MMNQRLHEKFELKLEGGGGGGGEREGSPVDHMDIFGWIPLGHTSCCGRLRKKGKKCRFRAGGVGSSTTRENSLPPSFTIFSLLLSWLAVVTSYLRLQLAFFKFVCKRLYFMYVV